MPKTSVELRQERAKITADIRVLNDRAEAENRDLSAEEHQQWDRGFTDIEALGERIKRQEYLEITPAGGDGGPTGDPDPNDPEWRAWKLRQDRSVPPTSEEDAEKRNARAYREAFREYLTVQNQGMLSPETWQTLRRGGNALGAAEMATLRTLLRPEQIRAMGISSQTGGGFWVPPEDFAEIQQAMLFYGGMREVAESIDTDGGGDLPWPQYDDTGNTGRLLTEGATATQTDIAVGVRMLKAHMYSSDEVLVSLQLLQDAPELGERMINQALGERIGRITNTHFTSYDAANGPQGLIRGTTLGVTAAATGAVTADELRTLKYAVNRAYRDAPGARYMMHDQTLRDILGLKDGNGNYIFIDSPRDGGEPTVWGKPNTINNDMPTMATGNIAVVYGDLKRYKIRNVKGFTLMRLDERYAPSYQVSFLGFSRHDGAYINPGQNPIQHLIMA